MLKVAMGSRGSGALISQLCCFLGRQTRRGWAGPACATCWLSQNCHVTSQRRFWMLCQKNINFSYKMYVWEKSNADSEKYLLILLHFTYSVSVQHMSSINELLGLMHLFLFVVCVYFRQKKLMDLLTCLISLQRKHLNARKSSKLSIISHKIMGLG